MRAAGGIQQLLLTNPLNSQLRAKVSILVGKSTNLYI